ncbi:MAG: VWA domain-containing protein [Blastocatellia bacterium]
MKIVIRSEVRLALFVFVLTALFPCVLRAQQTETQQEQSDSISIESNQVVLNVTVMDAATRFVTGLGVRDFQVFEDKAPQKIVNFSNEETSFAVVILLDVSGSMENKMAMARSACTTFVERIRDGDVVAIYTFGGTKVKKIQDFTEVRDVAFQLWDTEADGMTPMYDGVWDAVKALAKRPERRRAVLIVSDGADTSSRHGLEETIRESLNDQVTLYGVDLSDAALFRASPRDNGAEVLKTMALKTGGRFYNKPGTVALREAFAQTVDELRSQYTIVYEPSNEKRDGKWRTVEVRLKQPAYSVRTRQGYYARKQAK